MSTKHEYVDPGCGRSFLVRVCAGGLGLVVLAGRGAADQQIDDPTDGSTAISSSYVSPLSDFLNPNGGTGDDEMAASMAREKRIQELVAACMTDQGFDYEPFVYPMSSSASPMDDVDGGSRAFAEKYGYGISTFDDASFSTAESTVVDPNQAAVEAMSDGEREAYYAALWGGGAFIDGGFSQSAGTGNAAAPEPATTEPATTESAGSGGATAEAETESEAEAPVSIPEQTIAEPSMMSIADQGCTGQAQAEVYGDPNVQQTQFQSMFDAMDQLYTDVESDPAVKSAIEAWTGCMADAGHAGYTEVYAAVNEANEKWSELNGWNASEGVEMAPSSSSADMPTGPPAGDVAEFEGLRDRVGGDGPRLQAVVGVREGVRRGSDRRGGAIHRRPPRRVGAVPRRDERRQLMAGGRRGIMVVAVVAVVMAAGGFIAAKLVISPEDAAARTAAPTAAPITVPVEFKQLDADIVTRGDIGFSDSVQAKLATGGAEGGVSIVTGRLPEVGSVLENGTVMLEVTGRPVVALSGDLPTYRSLVAGSSGPDVEQLEATLAALGRDPGPLDKTYDAATGAAVAGLYAQLGYPAPQPGEDVVAALAAARSAADTADEGVAEAKKALTAADAGPVPSQRLSLQASVDAAQAAYDSARNTPSPPDQAAVDRASRALETASSQFAAVTEALAVAVDPAAVLDLSAQLEVARQAVAAAQSAVDEANQGEPPTPRRWPRRSRRWTSRRRSAPRRSPSTRPRSRPPSRRRRKRRPWRRPSWPPPSWPPPPRCPPRRWCGWPPCHAGWTRSWSDAGRPSTVPSSASPGRTWRSLRRSARRRRRYSASASPPNSPFRATPRSRPL